MADQGASPNIPIPERLKHLGKSVFTNGLKARFCMVQNPVCHSSSPQSDNCYCPPRSFLQVRCKTRNIRMPYETSGLEPSQLASTLEYLQCRKSVPFLCVKSGLPKSQLRCRLDWRVFRDVPPVTVREPCHFTYYRVGMPKLDPLTVRRRGKYPVCRVLMVPGPQDRLPRNWNCYG